MGHPVLVNMEVPHYWVNVLPIQKPLARSCKNLTQFMQVVSCTYLPPRNLAWFFQDRHCASRILHSTAKSCNSTISKIKMQDFLQESAKHLASVHSSTVTTLYLSRMTILSMYQYSQDYNSR